MSERLKVAPLTQEERVTVISVSIRLSIYAAIAQLSAKDHGRRIYEHI